MDVNGYTLDRVEPRDLPEAEQVAVARLFQTMDRELLPEELDLPAVDRKQVSEWSKLDPAGYRLERVDGVVPDRLVPAYLAASNGMNDAPKGELKMNDWKLTEQQI